MNGKRDAKYSKIAFPKRFGNRNYQGCFVDKTGWRARNILVCAENDSVELSGNKWTHLIKLPMIQTKHGSADSLCSLRARVITAATNTHIGERGANSKL